MSNTKYWPVYQGGTLDHLDASQVAKELRTLETISDACAQTIAAWWHSGSNSYTMMLSSTGTVDLYTSLSDFGNPDTDCETKFDAKALRALGAYIEAKQAEAESGAHACACDDCPSGIVYAVKGSLCHECGEAGCSATEHTACERDDAYEEC